MVVNIVLLGLTAQENSFFKKELSSLLPDKVNFTSFTNIEQSNTIDLVITKASYIELLGFADKIQSMVKNYSSKVMTIASNEKEENKSLNNGYSCILKDQLNPIQVKSILQSLNLFSSDVESPRYNYKEFLDFIAKCVKSNKSTYFIVNDDLYFYDSRVNKVSGQTQISTFTSFSDNISQRECKQGVEDLSSYLIDFLYMALYNVQDQLKLDTYFLSEDRIILRKWPPKITSKDRKDQLKVLKIITLLQKKDCTIEQLIALTNSHENDEFIFFIIIILLISGYIEKVTTKPMKTSMISTNKNILISKSSLEKLLRFFK